MPRTSGSSSPISIGPWYCDTCGGEILKPEEGTLVWLGRTKENGPATEGRDLRIVHHNSCKPACYPHEPKGWHIADRYLEECLRPNGLNQLLELVTDRGLDRFDVADIVMRLFVLGYEKRRRKWFKAMDYKQPAGPA